MKKHLIIIIILFSVFIGKVNASDYFDVHLESIYKFNESGTCIISDNFVIENKVTEKYLPSLEYKLNQTEIENVKVINGNNDIEPLIQKNDNSSTIKIHFDDKVLGKGNKRSFTIVYEIDNLASKTGDVWELSIPKNDNITDYESFKTKILVPLSFGEEAYVTPNYSEKTKFEELVEYSFDKEKLLDSRIVIGFGEYQILNFLINYRLTNEGPIMETQHVSIPPDTSYQRMFFESLEPMPTNIEVDRDGNWIAFYKVSPNSKLDIKISGNVQLFANPRKYLSPPTQNLYENIKPTEYWQSDNEYIVNLAKNLTTSKDAYDFVINSLSYDYSLSKRERIGALNMIKNGGDSSCREYTDLLIALLRAKGIPSREIIGFAYTDNPELKPITFYNDVLHSWVEYWDFEKKIWVSVDPTWGATSKSDYFSKFDLRHFAFTIHGIDDSNPIPPGFYNPNGLDKDIYINFGELKNNPEIPLEVKSASDKFFIFSRNNTITINNRNNYALYDKNIKYYYDDKLYYEDNIKIIPPYSEIHKRLHSDYSPLASSTPSTITVLINDKMIKFNGPKYLDMFSQIITIFILAIAATAVIILKHKNKHINEHA